MVLEYFFDFFIREVAVTYAREVPLATLQKHVLTITEIPNREGIHMPPWGGRCFLEQAGWGSQELKA